MKGREKYDNVGRGNKNDEGKFYSYHNFQKIAPRYLAVLRVVLVFRPDCAVKIHCMLRVYYCLTL